MTKTSGVTHTLTNQAHEWEERPWPLAVELAKILPAGSWTLVGGLMVRLRALIHEGPPTRATVDVDAAVALSRDSEASYRRLAQLLREADFAQVVTNKYAYRFVRKRDETDDIVDLMFPDGVSQRIVPVLKGAPVLTIPGGRRAGSMREIVRLQLGGRQDAAIYVPSLRDSLVVKGAAYLVDSRGRGRHLSDGITLLACVEQPAAIREGLSLRSRKRIRALLRGLGAREPWTQVDPVTRDLAELVLDEMCARFDVYGTINPESAARILDN